MKTKTYQVFSFSELSPSAQRKALDKMREFAAQDDWYDATFDDAKAMLKHAGFDVKDIHFSGFWSQGDGACFTGSWSAKDVDAKAMADNAPVDETLNRIARELEAIAKAYPQASLTVKHSGPYQHEFCTVFDVTIDENSDQSAPIWGEVEKSLIDLSRDAMRWIYQQLEQEHNDLTSDEVLIEDIEANNLEFTADGKIDRN